MEQLNLAILPQITYKAEGFVPHAGVRVMQAELLAILRHHKFAVAFVQGAPRSGKTHFSIRLASDLGAEGIYPRVLNGEDFAHLIGEGLTVRDGEIFIVDDAHLYFGSLSPGQSGPFVRWMEMVRSANGRVVFLSSNEASQFTFDDHVRSRLSAGTGFAIGEPSEEDLSELIDAIARQRGIRLTDRKTEYLEKRLRRDIASIEAFVEKVVHLAFVLGRPVGFTLLGDAL